MEDRLKLFLSMEGLTASQFATKMNIQRSGLSHLLSGRNKPSYDFITKMLSEYPNLNSEWLLLGVGKPYKNGITKAPTTPLHTYNDGFEGESFVNTDNHSSNTTENHSYSTEDHANRAPQTTQEASRNETTPSLFSPINEQSNDLDKLNQQVKKEVVILNKPISKEPIISPKHTQPEKRIKELVIFYTDGTYEVR